jgi:hypothetical protein
MDFRPDRQVEKPVVSIWLLIGNGAMVKETPCNHFNPPAASINAE